MMLGKVVPESVVPQNIVDFLIDENAELPEPDAFTFLNRLRSLGIGSADFVYLLEGCGAPQEAVDKIKANPAMNLQGLILTLESSGMTARDYTRILYTARQIWERTLTLRLENSERVSSEEEPAEPDNETEEETADETAYEEYEEYEETSFEEMVSAVSSEIGDNFEEPAPSETAKAAEAAEAAGAAGTAEEPAEPAPPPYPDATEELMSVDLGSGYEFTATLSFDKTIDISKILDGEQETEESKPANAVSEESIPDEMPSVSAPPREEHARVPETEPMQTPAPETFNKAETYEESNESEETEIPEETEFSEETDTADDLWTTSDIAPSETRSSDIPTAPIPFEVHIDNYDEPFYKNNEPAETFDTSEDEETAPLAEDNTPADDTDEITAASPEDFHPDHSAPFEIKINYEEDEPETPEPEPYNGQTTMIVPIDREMMKEKLAHKAEETDADYDEDSDIIRPTEKPLPKTAKQVKKQRQLDDNGDRLSKKERDPLRRPTKVRKGALIAVAIGAVILIGANVALGLFLNNKKKEIPISFAEDATAVFTDIYYAHNDNFPGGETVLEYPTDRKEVFGDLLLCGNGIGTFTCGDNVYSVTDSRITAGVFQNGEFTASGRFDPADGTKFVAAVKADDSLIVMYSGNECGYLKIQGKQTLYTVRQSGRLTDFSVEDGIVRIGSVYTPKFYVTFNAENTEVYLPKVGVDLKPISPEDVILSKTKGYSYALSAAYSLSDGNALIAKAAMGDAVYASADGIFMLNGSKTERDVTTEYGLVIDSNKRRSDEADSSEPLTAECEKIVCAASFAGGSAVCEDGGIVIRDRDLNACYKLTPLPKTPTELRFSGNVLIASDKDGVFLTADCSDLTAKPKIIQLTQASGSCGEDAAITLEASEIGVTLTRYLLENGTARKGSSFTRDLPSDLAKTLACGTANAMVAQKDFCGAAYSYFDGVSVISEYVTLRDAPGTATLFDDKTGFEYAFVLDGKIFAVCSKGAVDVTQTNETEPEEEPV